MRFLATAVLVLSALSRAETPLEVQLAAQSLRGNERARLEKVLGPLEAQPTYRVELEVDPARRTATGRVSVTVTPKSALDSLSLRLTPNAAHSGAITASSFEVNGAKQAVHTPDESLITVPLSPPAPAGQPLTVAFKLSAKLPPAPVGDDLLSGAGSSDRPGDYGAFSAGADTVSLVGVVPMMAVARADGTLWEGPSGIGDLGSFDPSNFIASVTVPQGWRVLSAGVQTGEVLDRQGRPRFTWAVAGARELPLLAVRGYESATATAGDIIVESWFLPKDRSAGKRALANAAKSLELLESRLGPFPFKTFRVVESRFAGGAGGMEFPGLVTIAASLYSGAKNPLAALGLGGLDLNALDPPGLDELSKSLGPMLETTLDFTVAHEVAHQYFAMLVGNDPVADPVVDEALTQHVALLLIEWSQGRKAADVVREQHLKLSYQLHRAMGGKDGPVLRPTWDFDSNVEYAALVYGKAPLLYDAWRAKLGNDAWVATLRTYVEQNRYRWVTANTLLNLAQKQGGGTLASLRKRWWEEKHGDEDVGTMHGLDLSGANMQAPDPAQLLEYQKALERLLDDTQ